MRNTIIIGSVLALVGFASVAQAGDRYNVSDPDAARVHREVSDDGRGERHDRYEGRDRSRERHDETSERRHESREMHDESHEKRDHR
jgi:hypothetical protein